MQKIDQRKLLCGQECTYKVVLRSLRRDGAETDLTAGGTGSEIKCREYCANPEKIRIPKKTR